MNILLLSIAPVVIIGIFIWLRDQYEREPIGLCLKALLIGTFMTIPVLLLESFLMTFHFTVSDGQMAFYKAFVVAAFPEETFKFIAVYYLIWKNQNFDEKFDGIVYAVFVALGFAMVENIYYVFNHGITTGYLRAVTAVPAHAIFGVTMGYYLGIARFTILKTAERSNLYKAYLVPICLHGIYDFILFKDIPFALLLFVPVLVYLYLTAFRKIKEHSDNSIYKTRKSDE